MKSLIQSLEILESVVLGGRGGGGVEQRDSRKVASHRTSVPHSPPSDMRVDIPLNSIWWRNSWNDSPHCRATVRLRSLISDRNAIIYFRLLNSFPSNMSTQLRGYTMCGNSIYIRIVVQWWTYKIFALYNFSCVTSLHFPTKMNSVFSTLKLVSGLILIPNHFVSSDQVFPKLFLFFIQFSQNFFFFYCHLLVRKW